MNLPLCDPLCSEDRPYIIPYLSSALLKAAGAAKRQARPGEVLFGRALRPIDPETRLIIVAHVNISAC